MILAVVVGIGINSGAIGSSAGSSSAAGRSVTGKTQPKARDRDTTALVRRLTAQNLRVEVISTSSDSDCARLSYGQVRTYFAENRCAAMYRVLLQVTDRRQAVAVVAVASVDTADESGGRKLKTLVDTYGTGNIEELTSSRRAIRSVRWTGQHYVSTRDGTTVVNAQAEPVGRTAAAATLAGIAATAVTTPS